MESKEEMNTKDNFFPPAITQTGYVIKAYCTHFVYILSN